MTCCNVKELKEFVANSTPLSMFTYYTGLTLQENVLAREVAKLVYKYATDGLVYLVQRRQSHFSFDFLVIKASRPPILQLVPFSDEKVRQHQTLKGTKYVNRPNKVSVERVNLLF